MRQEKKDKKRKQTSYVTLFSLKDKAALFPFVRGVMQYCTTKYHPRPKCGRNIHRYINIKVSPIHTYFCQLFPIYFFLIAFTQLHVIHVFEKMSGFVLVYVSVCVFVLVELFLCECLLSQPHAPSLQKPHACQIQLRMRFLRRRRRGRRAGGCQKSKTGEIYSNGR